MAFTDPTRNNRMVLLLIAGLPITMILGATWLWYFGERGDFDVVDMLGTANRGALVQPPRQLDDKAMFDETGAQQKYADLEARWTMLVPAVSERCDDPCEKALYLTRQIHVAMGKGFNRLQRLYISEAGAVDTVLAVEMLSDDRPAPADGDFSDYLATEHLGLKALKLEKGAYSALFAEHSTNPSTWYLVDPAGWIMMSYNSEVSYKDVISDLKFLLKNSGG
jgi:hypothetical protein